jgi:chloride channel 3/4/5
LIGIFTAIVAFIVDVAEATISDYKTGYCSSHPLRNRQECCTRKSPFFNVAEEVGEDCIYWKTWSGNYWASFGIYIGFAVAFGIIAGAVTLSTKANLPTVRRDDGNEDGGYQEAFQGKATYMVAGSGIPEIKTILSGFVIPHFLDLRSSWPRLSVQRLQLRLACV